MKKLITTIVLFFIVVCNSTMMGRAQTCLSRELNTENIPMVLHEEEEASIPLGIPCPEDYKKERKPLFLYNNVYEWTELYKVEGEENLYVAEEGNYLLLISLDKETGPVWDYTYVSVWDKKFVGVTDNYFIIEVEGNTYAYGHEGAVTWENLPEEEKNSRKEISSGHLQREENLSIERWLDGTVTCQSHENGTVVDILYTADQEGYFDTILLTNPVWYQFDNERMFFVQEVIGTNWKEAVFIVSVDGWKRIFSLTFEADEFLEANERGILYKRDGVIYGKSYYYVSIGGIKVYPEVSGSLLMDSNTYPSASNLEYGEKTSPATRTPPF